MKKLLYLVFFLALFASAQPHAGYYINGITYDTTNHTCCVSFMDSSSSSVFIESWYWNFGDSTPPVTVPNYTHCFTDTGIFEVCLVIQDHNGLSDTECCHLHFTDLDSAFLECDSLTGIFGTAANKIQFFPNPAKDHFTITGLNDSHVEIRIVSAQGNLVYRKEFSEKIISCDIENFSPGIYVVLLISAKGMLLRKVIVVQ